MRKVSKWLGVAAVGLTLTGCVSSKDHRAVRNERDVLRNEIITLRLETEAYRSQMGQVVAQTATKDELITNLTAQNASLQSELNDINAKYTQAMDMTGRIGTALPAQLSGDLSALAGAHQDFLEFDAGRGMLKFKSDVTFGSGSVELTPAAKQALAKLATILNGPSADGYELMIAGHTDNVKVTRASTIKSGHHDNWYLSAHRAIAVGNELRTHKVGGKRLAMVGYADQRPVADNASVGGRAMNRRVEILVLPTKVQPSVVVKTPAPAGGTNSPATQPVLPDATTWSDTGSLFNK